MCHANIEPSQSNASISKGSLHDYVNKSSQHFIAKTGEECTWRTFDSTDDCVKYTNASGIEITVGNSGKCSSTESNQWTHWIKNCEASKLWDRVRMWRRLRGTPRTLTQSAGEENFIPFPYFGVKPVSALRYDPEDNTSIKTGVCSEQDELKHGPEKIMITGLRCSVSGFGTK